MKHLKTYKLFESKKEIDYSDIEDILYELIDEGYLVSVKKGTKKSINVFGKWLSFISYVLIAPSIDSIEYMKFSDIKSEILRLKDYLGDKWLKVGVVFVGHSERIEIDINEQDYDELDQLGEISDIVIFFTN